MNETIVDILIPAYNKEKFIAKCIKSVICQTYKYWRLLILDDGSTDRTYELCKAFSKRDERICVYHQENCGLVETRKRLISQVTGDYFMFMDADDLLHTQAVEVLLSMALKLDADIVTTKNIKTVSHKFEIGRKRKKLPHEPEYEIIDREWGIRGMCGYPQLCVAMHSKIYKNRLKETNLSRMPHGFYGEDRCFNILLFEQAERIVLLDLFIYFYRDGGRSARYYNGLAADLANLYSWRKNYIREHGFGAELERSNLLNLLDIYKDLSSGNQVQGKEDCRILQGLLYDIDELQCDCPELKAFYKKLSDSSIIRLPKVHSKISIRVKRMILHYL